MTKQEFFELCSSSYLTQTDYPFAEDFEATKSKIKQRKGGIDENEKSDSSAV